MAGNVCIVRSLAGANYAGIVGVTMDELKLDERIIQELKQFAEDYVYLNGVDDRHKIEEKVIDYINNLRDKNDSNIDSVLYLQIYRAAKCDYEDRKQDEYYSDGLRLLGFK